MQSKLRYFCLFVVFSALCFLLIGSWYDFRFFESKNYADMADVYDCISVGRFPTQEELESYHLDGVSSYTADFSSKTDQWTVNIYGRKQEHVMYVFTKDFESVFYKNYSNSTKALIFIICLSVGFILTINTKTIIKKYTKKEKVN